MGLLTIHSSVLKKKYWEFPGSVQWLGLCAFTAEGLGSIPGRGTKIPQAARRGQNQPNKQNQVFIFLKNQQPSNEADYTLY